MKLPEDPGRDFPFYRGVPTALTPAHWWFLLALVAAAFALLIAPIPWPGGQWVAFLPAVLFPLIPLAGLAWVSNGHARCLFGAVGWRGIRLMVLFALLNITVTMVVGAIVKFTLGAVSNPAIATAPALVVVGFLMMSLVQEMDLASADEGIPAFLTLLLIPLTQSICWGIGVGFIVTVVVKVLSGKAREVSPWFYGISLIFVLHFAL